MPAPKKNNETSKSGASGKKAAAPAKSKAVEPAKPNTEKTQFVTKVRPAPAYPAPMLELMEGLRKDAKWQKFLAEQKQALLDLRDNVLDSMAGVTRDTLRNHPEGSEASGSGEHQADAGSDAYDRDFALSILSKEQNALFEIEEALSRIDYGSYGICEICYKTIPVMRLKAIPFARLTVDCQSQWEKEKGPMVKYTAANSSFGFRGIQQNEGEMSVSLDDDDE